MRWLLAWLAFLPALAVAAPITVSYGPDPKQAMDVYTPTGAVNAPIIIFVHPGGWQIGDKADADSVKRKGPFFSREGYVFISVNHRLVPKVTPVEQANDVAQAIAYAQRHAKTWGADPRRVILMGHSSGAHLVDLLGASPRLLKAQGGQPVIGVISLDSAALRIDRIMEVPRQWFYNPVFGDDRALWSAASPYEQLEKGAPPFLLVCSRTAHSSCRYSQEFAAKAQALGTHVTVLPEDYNHSMSGYAVGMRSNPVHDAVVAYIRQLLKN